VALWIRVKAEAREYVGDILIIQCYLVSLIARLDSLAIILFLITGGIFEYITSAYIFIKPVEC
jgi:hypothetical protein